MLEDARAAGSWRLFAFHHHRPENYRRERLPLHRLEQAIRWAELKDVTTIMLEHDERPSFEVIPGVVHHICDDPGCPGGC